MPASEFVCNDCARRLGLMPKISAPVRDNNLRRRKFNKHTIGSSASPLNGVWLASDTNTVRGFQDDALSNGVLEIIMGRSTNVVHVLGRHVGDLYSYSRYVGPTDAVQITLSSNTSAMHAFPVGTEQITNGTCRDCGKPICPPPSRWKAFIASCFKLWRR